MELLSKEQLIDKLKEIGKMGWVANARPGNVGGVGNTLEDLLGISENNLPIPNAAEWELKCQRIGTSSLTTLFHMEPSPRAYRFVPKMLLPCYGWKHESIPGEMSFRQTLNGLSSTDRGFKVVVDRSVRKVLISFNASDVNPRHSEWLKSVDERIGLGELNPQPYWGFNDLFHKAGTKLLNFTSNITSLIFFALGGHVLWLVGLSMGIAQVSGAWLGSHLAIKHGAKLIRPVLVVISLAISFKLLISN